MTRRSLTLGAILVLGAGCRGPQEAPYPTWAEPEAAYRPTSGSDNAFDRYVELAGATEEIAPDLVRRVVFTGAMKSDCLKKLSSILGRLQRATAIPCTYELRLKNAFDPDENAPAWRLIGRALSWEIENAVVAEDWDAATTWTIVATKFGFDLTQGDSASATLGFAIVGDARKAIAPSLGKMQAKTLRRLSEGTINALQRYKGLEPTIKNESKRMAFGVQFVQDARRQKNYQDLERRLGKSSKQAIKYLQDLSEDKRGQYFQGFSSEGQTVADYWTRQADRSRPEREPELELTGERPWKRFARAFFSTLGPVFSIADDSIARTRLLALTAWATSVSKSTGSAPKSLAGMKPIVTDDPYAKSSLIYSSSGQDFKVYSVGMDGEDDGGDSVGAGPDADIVLETGLD